MAMDGWKKVKLGELVDITSSKRIFMSEYEKKGVPFYRGKEIIEKSEEKNPTNQLYISDEKYNKLQNEFGVPLENDILLTAVGTIGVPYIVKNEKFYFKDGNIIWLKNFREKLYYKFLYYWFFSLEGQNQLDTRTIGSTQKALTITELKKFDISLPTMNVQKRISKILSSLDEKIKLNNEINNNLEKQAWLLFNKYFINNKNIHKEWSTISLTSIANFLNGIPINRFQPSVNEDYLPVLKIKELRQGFTDSQSDICSTNIDKQYIIRNGDLIFSWSGTLLVDFWCGDKCILNQHLFKVTSEKLDLWFVFLWLKYHLESFINIAKNKATTMGHIKRKDLEKTFILLPNEDDYEKLSNLFSPIFKKIILSKLENKKLKHIKKQLLPRLLSGQIDVSQIKL